MSYTGKCLARKASEVSRIRQIALVQYYADRSYAVLVEGGNYKHGKTHYAWRPAKKFPAGELESAWSYYKGRK